MKFTIVVPTFNAKAYLSQCLDSIKRQDFPAGDFEIVLVDDCSTDDTLAYASGFCASLPNLRVLALEKNDGPGAARNAGLDAAAGDWVLFLDSDDELAGDCLSSIGRVIDQNPGEALGAIGFDWAAETSAADLNSSKRVGRRDGRFLNDRGQLIRQYLSHRMDGSVIYTAARRSLLDAFKIRFAHGLHEDVDFIFRVYYHAPAAAYLDKILYKKRNHAASIINTVSAAHIEGYFRAWTAIGDFLRSPSIEPTLREEYAGYYSYGSIGVIATRVREVIRHGSNHAEMRPLFELIYASLHRLFAPEAIVRQLAQGKTTYFAIADLFWRVMSSTSIADAEKPALIAKGVAEMGGKSWSCTDLHHSAFLRPDQVRTCCKRFFVDGKMQGDVVLFDVAGPENAPISSKAILDAKRNLHQKINSGEASACDGCPFLEFGHWSSLNQLDIKYLSLEYHSVCNLKCTYCSDEYYGGKQASYDIRKTIDGLLADGTLENCALIVWGGGEPVVAKEFDTLLQRFAGELPQVQQRVLTNSVKRSEALESLLAGNRAQIVTSIDAGTDKTFRLIRGRPGLKKVCKNLQAYAQINHARVTVKYIFTEGNGSISEVRRFADLVSEWGLLQCNFQISGDFKEEVIGADVASAMILMFGLLRKAGAGVVYFDELLRHRLGSAIDLDDVSRIESIHESAGFDFIASPQRYPLVAVWGAGQQAKYLLEGSAFFRKSKVAFFVDATPAKIGTQFFGREVCDPSALIGSDLPVVIAAVQGVPLILEQFRALGLAESRLIRDLII